MYVCLASKFSVSHLIISARHVVQFSIKVTTIYPDNVWMCFPHLMEIHPIAARHFTQKQEWYLTDSWDKFNRNPLDMWWAIRH